MVSKITTNYDDRLVDVLAMDVPNNVLGFVPQLTGLRFSEPQKIVAGIQQSVQSFLSLLLTRRGTARNSAIGCEFMALLRTRPPQTEVDVVNYYQAAIPLVIQQVNETITKEDERIASASLTGVALEETQISLRISIVTEAGASAEFIAPIEGI